MTDKMKRNSSIDPALNEAILDSISDGVFTVDGEWRITSFNRAAEEITGVAVEEAIGNYCSDVFRSSMCESTCALRHTLATGRSVTNRVGYIITADGGRVPISLSTAVLRDSTGKVIGGAETFRDMSEVEALRQELAGRFQVGDLISHSPAMRNVFELATAVADSVSTVLIQGETGTGKELLARAVHGMSPRAGKPFVAINCGAFPDSLLESELFGYKRGAFTGAHRDKPGRFALAQGGTLFLDEIGEISPAMQVRLLRVLQEHTYEPLGGTKTESMNVRILAATNRDLAAEVKSGGFREDLFYRINVIRVDLPPLRKRKEDIPLLADHFIRRFNRLQGREVVGLSSATLSLLMAHYWPGNVRELENVIERAFVMCGGKRIEEKHLPPELSGGESGDTEDSSIDLVKRVAEAASIRRALERNGFNRLAAARELGIHKTTLYRKIKTLGITLPEQDGRTS
ncbi:MAG: PAS domain S-box protein [bacterium]|nr:PAS domain S-box protein [bacterium]